MQIALSKTSDVPLRQQLAEQIVFLITTGQLQFGEELPSVRSLWFIAHEQTLHERMVKAGEFYGGASDEEAMIRHYLARSFWYNTRLKEAVKQFALTSIELPLRAPVHAIVEMCLEQLRR